MPPAAPQLDASKPHALLNELYRAATSAVAPGPALISRLERLALDPARPIHLIALGKAAGPMAEAAVSALRRRGIAPAGGVVVAPLDARAPHPSIRWTRGDHPEPGSNSLAAASALGTAAANVEPGHEVWLLLSGGTTALVGAPVEGVSPSELSALYTLLLGSGLEITAMNRIRKRFSRWGGGRLARALAPARVRMFIVSDVIGDDLASIGSGPCVPDSSTAAEVRELLECSGLWDRIPAAARAIVTGTERGELSETPKAGDAAFAGVTSELIASNRLALEAAAVRARELGMDAEVIAEPLEGEAADAGTRLAGRLLQHCTGSARAQCTIWGGETTVTLGDSAPGLGGRSQELALAAAQVLDGVRPGVALLAGGTDGRDGPTDAAGAIVDGATWSAAARAGRDPARDLRAHDAYRALDAAGALIRPGLTGTNVMDVVFGLCLGR